MYHSLHPFIVYTDLVNTADKKTPQDLLREYYEKQKAAKRSYSPFGKKQKSESAAAEDIYVCVNEYKGSLNVHSNCRLKTGMG